MKKMYTLTAAVLLTALFFTACDRKQSATTAAEQPAATDPPYLGQAVSGDELDQYVYRIVSQDQKKYLVAYKTGAAIDTSTKKTVGEGVQFDVGEMTILKNSLNKVQFSSNISGAISDPSEPREIVFDTLAVGSNQMVYTNENGIIVHQSGETITEKYPVSRLLYVNYGNGSIVFGWAKQTDIKEKPKASSNNPDQPR